MTTSAAAATLSMVPASSGSSFFAASSSALTPAVKAETLSRPGNGADVEILDLGLQLAEKTDRAR